MLRTAKVLALARPNIWYPGKPGCPVERPEMLDHEWLPIVGEQGWPVIMRDKKIRKRTGERLALVEAGVQAFVLTGAGQATTWDQVLLLARHWETLERLTHEVPGPCMFAVTTSQVRLLPLPEEDD